MKLRSKIISGYLLLSLVFSGGILVSLHAFGQIERSFERLSAENLPVLNLIQNIRTQGSLLHAEMLEMSYLRALELNADTRRALSAEQAEIEHTREQLLTAVKEYRRLVELYFPEESAYIPLLQTQVDQMILMSDELGGSAEDQPEFFSLRMKNRFEDLEQHFLAVTGEIVSHEVREIHMRREQVSQAVAKARFRIGLTSAVSLAMALLIALLLTRLNSAAESDGCNGRRLGGEMRRREPRD